MAVTPPLAITGYTLASALGTNLADVADALRHGDSGLSPASDLGIELDTSFGAVRGLEDVQLPPALRPYECRNHRLALMALEANGFQATVSEAVRRVGPRRVGLFLGTSTSGIAETETAYLAREGDSLPAEFDFHATHELASLTRFVAAVLGVRGPSLVVSTACSSSAKVFGVAERFLRSGFCDAAVVGGADSLCLTTMYGFHALELVARTPCRPWGHVREGISIGEAAGFALLERGGDGVRFLGQGESSDAHHMSSPHPEGRGAGAAMQGALEAAGLAAEGIDYVNLHGTGTPSNDAAEDRAVTAVFGNRAPCSSTKRATGHTLGAAGIVESLVCCLALEESFLPGGGTDGELDPHLRANFLVDACAARLNTAASLSLGFGGSNCCVILGRPS